MKAVATSTLRQYSHELFDGDVHLGAGEVLPEGGYGGVSLVAGHAVQLVRFPGLRAAPLSPTHHIQQRGGGQCGVSVVEQPELPKDPSIYMVNCHCRLWTSTVLTLLRSPHLVAPDVAVQVGVPPVDALAVRARELVVAPVNHAASPQNKIIRLLLCCTVFYWW